jgi:hypothetical protein
MNSKIIQNIVSWSVFAIAFSVYFLSAERTGSLWDCGEFILGAYKLQVVHPPGAPLFLLIGRIFTYFAELFSDNPENIAFSVNLMSGLVTAFAAMFIARITILLGELIPSSSPKNYVILGFAGLIAGLTTAFSSSIWFSAVEGEVYALSTFFTVITLWATVKWYSLPEDESNDKWLLFAVYMGGLSIGVHLLSILTFPALALFYYFKKYSSINIWGIIVALGAGLGVIVFIQTFIIVGIPKLWASMDLFMVNQLGMPFHSGLLPTLIFLGAAVAIPVLVLQQKIKSSVPLYVLGGLAVIFSFLAPSIDGSILPRLIFSSLFFAAGFWKESFIRKGHMYELLIIGATFVVIAFSTVGVVVIRANAEPPINMNAPYDAMRLIPYLNREQYGERALVKGPHFEARPSGVKTSDRYGRSGDRYEIVDQKINYEFKSSDEMLFPRMGDYSQNRNSLYKRWLGLNPDAPLPPGRPNQVDNISFMLNYQFSWMYWRYFMWNFSGRQNGDQGFFPWDKSSGHWISGIPFLDDLRLFNQSLLPDSERNNKARNTYFLLPFLFGLLGLFYHFKKQNKDAFSLLALFIITGLGIIIYSNQPPNEPRERDYVLVGSFFTFAIWVGLGALALFNLLVDRFKWNPGIMAWTTGSLALIAPLLMGFQNFDDQSRRYLSGSRDYASNFLESCDPNAIIFTYGDNDTYPLWYAQEVEGIRRDVRVVNLSLITVDWYIDLLRRKVNDSPPIKLSLSSEALRGKKRNQVLYYNPQGEDRPMNALRFLQFIGEDHPLPLSSGEQTESYMPTRSVFIPVNRDKVLHNGIVSADKAEQIVPSIPVNLTGKSSMIKDELAVLDIIANNLEERPVYFAVTSRQEKLLGLQDFLQLEGLALKVVPIQGNSDGSYGIIGSGSVDSEKIYERVTTKFKWGGFDQYDLFVDESFAPSVQSHQLVIRRAAFDLIAKGQPQKAVELIDQYFKGFPANNFPYDYRAYYMIEGYIGAGAFDKAKIHIEILAKETGERLRFFGSIPQDIISSSFNNDFMLFNRMKEDLINSSRRIGDEGYVNQIQNLLTI